MATYSLRLILKWLKELEQPIRHQPMSSAMAIFYETGVQLWLPDPRRPDAGLIMSIQTHPHVAGMAFAETAILNPLTRSIAYPASLGYEGDVLRWEGPEELKEHVLEVKRLLEEDFDAHAPPGDWAACRCPF